MKITNLIILSFFLIITGCSSRESAVNIQEFVSIVEKEGFSVNDTKEMYNTPLIKESLEAVSENFTLEFMVASSIPDANQIFNQTKNRIELRKGSNVVATSSEFGNKSRYTLNSSGVYYFLSKIDDTVIYIETDSSNKKRVDDIIKKLEY